MQIISAVKTGLLSIAIGCATMSYAFSTTVHAGKTDNTDDATDSNTSANHPHEIYVDQLLPNVCLHKYSIVKRNCTGTDGTAYTSIQNAVDKLQASDTLLIRQGIYREQVALSSKIFTKETAITISAYRDEFVVINAAEVISNWKKCQNKNDCQGNPNWQYLYHSTPGFTVKQLFQKEKKSKPSRFPNQGWLYPTRITNNPQSEFYDSTLKRADDYFDESIVNIKTTPYWMSNIPVRKSYSNGRILLEKALENFKGQISKEYGYYFTHIIEEINEEGEWAYDETTKKLYLWPSRDFNNVDLDNIQASKREYGFHILNSTYIDINNITIKHPNGYGIWIHGSDHVNIDNVEIAYSYTFGVFVQGAFSTRRSANYNRISNSTIKYSNYRGITNDNASDYIQISGNQVYATGTDTFGGDLTHGVGHGIFVEGTNAKVLNNRIDKTGYTSIYLSGSQRTNKEIAYNHISNSNLSLNDGAGIYAGGKSSTNEIDAIHHNIIQDTYGYVGGIKKNAHCDLAPSAKKCSKNSHGIYLDEQANHFAVKNNTVTQSKGAGIYLHWTKNNTLEGNTLYDNQIQIWLSGAKDPKFKLEGNNLSNNIFFSTSKNQTTFFYGVNYNDYHFGNSDQNYYSNLYHEKNIHSSRYVGSGEKIDIKSEHLSLLDWQKLSGKDVNSNITTLTYLTENRSNLNFGDAVILLNATINEKNYALENKHCDLNGAEFSNNIKLDAFSSTILLKCFCNRDKICNNNETMAYCPEDCPS